MKTLAAGTRELIVSDIDSTNFKETPRVLIIDDNPDFSNVMTGILETRGVQCDSAQTGREGLFLAECKPYDLVVLDMGLPDISGFEICQTLQAHRDLRNIPIMIITGSVSIDDKVRGFELGAVDFVTKPFNIAEVEARILAAIRKKQSHETQLKVSNQERERTHAELLRIGTAVDAASDAIMILDANRHATYINSAFVQLLRLKIEDLDIPGKLASTFADPTLWNVIWSGCQTDGSWHGEIEVRPAPTESATILCRANAIVDQAKTFLGIVCIYTDITHRKRLEKDLLYLAYHDPLTDLHNRRSFRELLLAALEKARSGAPSCLLYLDLDNFKVINESAGHHAGDNVLREIAEILSSKLRPIDQVGRFGGDEFTILLRDVTPKQALRVAQRLLTVLDEYRFAADGKTFSTSASIGLAAVEPNLTPEDIMAHADAACHLAKAKGRNDVEVYHADSLEIQRLGIEAGWSIQIKEALREKRMEIWLQPIVPLKPGKRDYYEVLVRMRDQAGQIILPSQFLPAAEHFGNLMPLDKFVVKSSIELMGKHPGLQLSINLSAKTVTDPGLPDLIERLLRENNVLPSNAAFEITETAMIQNLAYARELILHIKELGCRFALDDFGSGASSMMYLRDLPIDCLKIDGGFVRSLDQDKINRALVKSMTDVAHILGKETVAEYVVNQAVLDIVTSLGIDYAQGWHLCQPAPPEEFLHTGTAPVV